MVYRSRPEAAIQRRIIDYLTARGWLVERMHGNAFQKGIPDLFCFHPQHGFRWVDVKVEGRNTLTKAQCQKWPKWEKTGLGVWIMTDASDEQYAKLFGPANFRAYWKPRYDKYLLKVEEIIDDIALDNDDDSR